MAIVSQRCCEEEAKGVGASVLTPEALQELQAAGGKAMGDEVEPKELLD